MDTLIIVCDEQPSDNDFTSCHGGELAFTRSVCPCHPKEVRTERFAVLDALIKAKWGSIPMHMIEREVKKNGRILVSSVPERYLVVDQTPDPVVDQ